MLHHASYIASSATAKTAVLELAQTVEAHQALQAPLQALLGRLDLLLHKQSEAKRARGGGASRGDDVSDDSDAEGPANVYDEGDEDLEDVMAEGDEERHEESAPRGRRARRPTGSPPRPRFPGPMSVEPPGCACAGRWRSTSRACRA